jgi:aerobic-type carbon monoxide dehydrogenase small subunit (CoxS/CutS family)
VYSNQKSYYVKEDVVGLNKRYGALAMADTIHLTLNGKKQRITTDPRRTLLDVIREDFALIGTKYGCGEGDCRSCTVLIDGKPRQACQIAIGKAADAAITTIEGLADNHDLHPLQQAFIDESAMQCGYCVPGMILTAEALLRTNPSPTHEEIDTFMNGNICRCGNYINIVNAIEKAAHNTEARLS